MNSSLITTVYRIGFKTPSDVVINYFVSKSLAFNNIGIEECGGNYCDEQYCNTGK